MRLAAWIRVSRFKGQEFAEGYQETDQDGWAQRHGHEITHRFHELNVSGARLKRKHLDEILRLLEAGAIDGVIVAYVSRFARSLRVSETFLAEFERLGGVLICANENLVVGGPDEDPNQRTMFNYAMTAADAEWRMKRALWARVHKSKIAGGVPMGVPYGYRRGPGKRLVIHEEEAGWVRTAFQMRVNGHGTRAIARHLNEQGAPTPKGKSRQWMAPTIQRLLACRTYLGEIRHGNERQDRCHPAIVDPALFKRARMEVGKPITGEKTRLLAGLLRCSGCRGTMKGRYSTVEGDVIYVCRGESGGGKCPEPARASELETLAALRRDFIRILNSAGGYRFKAVAENSEVLRLRAELDGLEAHYQDVRQDERLKAIDREQWYTDVEDAKAALDATRDELKVALKAADVVAVTDQGFEWPEDEEGQRDLLTGTFAVVFLGGGAHRAFVRGSALPELPRRGKVNDLGPLVWDRDEPDSWEALGK